MNECVMMMMVNVCDDDEDVVMCVVWMRMCDDEDGDEGVMCVRVRMWMCVLCVWVFGMVFVVLCVFVGGLVFVKVE